MSVLEVKTTSRACEGVIIGVCGTIKVKVFKPKGLICYRLHVDGKDKGWSELTAENMWAVVCNYFGVKTVRAPETKKKGVK